MAGRALQGLGGALLSPAALAGRAMGRVLYGPAHPYALAATIGANPAFSAITPACAALR